MFNTPFQLFKSGKLNKEFCNMTFDWEKAARLINHKKPFIAYAMLEDNWEQSRCKIYQGGLPVYEEGAVYSMNLRPMLVMDDGMPIPCFKMEYETNGMEVWPRKALRILEGKE